MTPLRYDFAPKDYLRRPALSWPQKIAFLTILILACGVFA